MSKVARPVVISRVVKPAQGPVAAHGGDITALVTIAEYAGKSQIRLCGFTSVLLADDVLNLAAQKCILLMNQAVFT